MYDISNNHSSMNTHIFDIPKEPELFNTEVIEEKVQHNVTQEQSHHKKNEDKDFEPISFDDLFSDEF